MIMIISVMNLVKYHVACNRHPCCKIDLIVSKDEHIEYWRNHGGTIRGLHIRTGTGTSREILQSKIIRGRRRGRVV